MSSKSSRELSLLILSAAVLGVVDTIIPRPLPFFKIGLANIASVVSVVRFGYLRTLELNLIRAVSVALITGILATPTFILSLSGALTSATVMWAVYRFSGNKVSLAGISVAGAVSSLWAQLLAAGVILHDIPLRNILPLLTVWGVVSGLLVGTAAETALRKLFDGGVLRRAEG